MIYRFTVRLYCDGVVCGCVKRTVYYSDTVALKYKIVITGIQSTFAKGVSKVIPVVGGVVSGGITLASMLPMGNRLAKTLDKAHFDYTMADFEADFEDISEVCNQETESESSGDVSREEILASIQKAKQMLDDGIITDEEFSEIKAKLISQI